MGSPILLGSELILYHFMCYQFSKYFNSIFNIFQLDISQHNLQKNIYGRKNIVTYLPMSQSVLWKTNVLFTHFITG